MHSWLVGGALIEGPGGVLLVRNERRGGRTDWTPPGGVIDPGEELLAGLTREVREETGLVVTRWEGPLYEIAAEAPGLGWTLRVEVHRAVELEGDLVIDDPDGIVVEASYVDPGRCGEHLAAADPWVAEPLLSWLDGRWEGTRAFSYLIEGDDPGALRITRI